MCECKQTKNKVFLLCLSLIISKAEFNMKIVIANVTKTIYIYIYIDKILILI